MSIESGEKIEVQLFLGCQVTAEIRNELNANIHWKASQIVHQSQRTPGCLNVVPFKGKEYLGHFISESEPSLAELGRVREAIEQEIRFFCPDVNISKLHFIIFTQLFIS